MQAPVDILTSIEDVLRICCSAVNDATGSTASSEDAVKRAIKGMAHETSFSPAEDGRLQSVQVVLDYAHDATRYAVTDGSCLRQVKHSQAIAVL